jgi:hypothetical protein
MTSVSIRSRPSSLRFKICCSVCIIFCSLLLATVVLVLKVFGGERNNLFVVAVHICHGYLYSLT